MEKAFCLNCEKDVEYKIKSLKLKTVIKGTLLIVPEKQAYCCNCNNEIYVPELNDFNAESREKTYIEYFQNNNEKYEE